jgi:drebrin-like protein
VFQPTKVGGGSFAPLGNRTRVLPTPGPVDSDGWGEDAPEITRTQLEKVGTAYQPTKVNLAEYSHGKKSPEGPDAVRGAYQPVGKVDIAEIRRQAKAGGAQDDRPTTIKGAYEPVGKVDIAAIRARAQPPVEFQPQTTGDDDYEPQPSLADRSAAFQQSERITTLPKPRVANKLGGIGSFGGTRAPVPAGFAPKTNPTAAPVGTASRTFADQGGKTPAQIWAEKKALAGGVVAAAAVPAVAAGIVASQKSGDGGWKSGYTGKSWAAVQTTTTGQSATSNNDEPPVNAEQEEEEAPSTNISSIRDRFAAAPPPVDFGSRPGASGRTVPPPPEEEEVVRSSSPIRVALPIRKAAEPEPEPTPAPRPVPIAASGPAAASAGKKAIVQYDYEKAEDNEIELKEGEYVTEIEAVDPDWWMGRNAQGQTGLFPSNYVEVVEEGEEPAEHAAAPPHPAAGGPTATAEFGYEAAEDNELSFPEGATVHNVVCISKQSCVLTFADDGIGVPR